VVKGDQHPNVYLFSQPHEALSATVLDREEDDIKGLALLLLKSRQPIPGIDALKLRSTSELGNGESVRVIGFPDGTSLWTVETGNIKRLQGRDLILSGMIREGESGSPVILNQQVTGLVTDITQAEAYAVRAEIISRM
jgi:V8-like Glu-specific endopeptidase